MFLSFSIDYTEQNVTSSTLSWMSVIMHCQWVSFGTNWNHPTSSILTYYSVTYKIHIDQKKWNKILEIHDMNHVFLEKTQLLSSMSCSTAHRCGEMDSCERRGRGDRCRGPVAEDAAAAGVSQVQVKRRHEIIECACSLKGVRLLPNIFHLR